MIIFIDNYDSFTFNLVHYFEMIGQKVLLYKNDQISIKQIEQLNPKAILISPGPCSPNEAGISLEVIKKFTGKIPIIGICLGHQAIAKNFGAKIIKAPQPCHGKISKIIHNNHYLFKGVPKEFYATRYHSLIVDHISLPKNLIITSQTEDGIIMSLSHKIHNIHGIQFHPESILTSFGIKILINFIEKLDGNKKIY